MTRFLAPITPLQVSEIGWSLFLRLWSNQIIELLKRVDRDLLPLEQEAVTVGYLGYPGASEQEILATEERLNIALPYTYKEFLRASNGWRQIGMDADDGKLFSVNEIDLFRIKYPDAAHRWLSAIPEDYSKYRATDEQYFIYGLEQDSITLRDEYIATAFAISEQIDAAIYLLNPMIIAPDGEWEAWFFGYKLPGANRYRSFQEMMEAEYLRIMQNLESTTL